MSELKKWAFVIVLSIAVASMVFIAGCGVKEKIWENDKFSILIPDGWETKDMEGGVQLFTKDEVFHMVVEITRNNVTETEIKAELEKIVKSQNSSPIEEVTMLGVNFFKTNLMTENLDQTVYVGVRNGEKVAILLVGKDHKNNKEMRKMMESIKFK